MDTASFLWGAFAGVFVAWTLLLTLMVTLSYKASKRRPEHTAGATREDIR